MKPNKCQFHNNLWQKIDVVEEKLEQQGKDIERLYASRTKLLELEKEVEKLKAWEHKLDEISKELVLEDVEELKERVEKLEKKTWAISDDGHYLPLVKEKE